MTLSIGAVHRLLYGFDDDFHTHHYGLYVARRQSDCGFRMNAICSLILSILSEWPALQAATRLFAICVNIHTKKRMLTLLKLTLLIQSI